jgi:PAS domain S-box-containing protein
VRDHVALVRPGVLGNATVALLLAGVQWEVIEARRVLLWLSLLLVPFAWRVALAHAHRQSHDAPPQRWLTRFRQSYALQGVAWGAASLLLFPTGNVPHQVFLTFALGGITAAAITLTAFDLVAGLMFLGLALLPVVARLILEGGRIQTTMAAVVALFLAYMAVNASRAHRRWREGVDLRRAVNERAEALARYQTVLTSLRPRGTIDPADLFQWAVTASVQALDLSQAALWTQGGPGLTMHVEAVAARPGEAAPGPATVHALDTSHLADVPFEVTAVDGSGSRIDVPVRTGGQLDGVLRCHADVHRAWTDDDVNFLGAVASIVAAGLEERRRRHAERALRELNENLERLVEERTGALLEGEARFRAVFDQSPAIIALISLEDHRIVEVNGAGQAAFGLTRGEAVGRTSADLGLWVDADARRRTLDALRDRGAIAGVEVQMRRRSGEVFWALLNSSAVSIGGHPYSLSTLVDITDRKHAVQALAESEARFRALFDKGPIVVLVIRLADGCIAEINDAGLQTFGFDRHEVIGRTALELELWVDPGERTRALSELQQQGGLSAREAQLRRKTGQVFWALFSSSLVTIDGEPYILSTLQDVTERRQLEAQFLQSQKMEVLGHLAGGVAHDFNNVLTVIRSTAELALDAAGEGTALHEALETIRGASARASGLTSQLLAFSRRQILQPTVIDVNDLVRDLTPMLRRAIGERIALETTPSVGPATILADRSSIEQVILNLAINARDAMAIGGSLTIAVGVVAAVAGPGRQITLTLTDTGEGMSEATLQRVFEPFFTTKDVGKGTGLGLSTAHGIVSQSGGQITVRSTPGVGTTFTVSLPWVERAPAPVAPGRGGVVGGDETILVVDDDADIRDVVRRALSSAGYQVLMSPSGDDALRLLGRHAGRVHLLLTDVVMPGISGQDLAEQVQLDHPSVRILYTSGFVDDAVEANGGLADVPFIAKPYSLKALTQKVRDVLDA